MSSRQKPSSSGWGGARENAGRKSIWKNRETCTMRIPRVFSQKLYELAQRWDKEGDIEAHSRLNPSDFEKQTNSNWGDFDSVTKTNALQLPELSEAIDLAKQILNNRQSARISLAKFLSKLYSIPVNSEDLQ